jgi:hypothetical protein
MGPNHLLKVNINKQLNIKAIGANENILSKFM